MNHEKTFEAINKLKDIEIELHRLKNALEMTDRALEAKDIAWKAYEEVQFSSDLILRWVREGDFYVSRIDKELMEKLKNTIEPNLKEHTWD